MSADVYAAALAAHEAGVCVLPAAEDGSKQPITAWKLYQRQRPRPSQLRTWYVDEGRTGLVYVTGSVSGGLEGFEFDDRAAYAAFLAGAPAAGFDGTVEKIRGGYEEETPGGVHWLLRCAETAGNTALAKRPKLPEEMRTPQDKTKTLIETRGSGGCMIVAPSHGGVHPTGRPYRLLHGGVDSIATITPRERAELWAYARSFDQMPKPAPRELRGGSHGAGGGTRPGDALNRSVAWVDILGSHGWVPLYERNGATYWRRPGKSDGVSATTDYQGNGLLWVFTSSTEFEPDRSYTRFGAYAMLEHGGDFAAAARFLASRGYGTRAASSAAPAPGRHARYSTRTVRVA